MASWLLSVAITLLVCEITGFLTWLAYRIIEEAVEILPESVAERYKSEWFGELDSPRRRGSSLLLLGFAISTYLGTPKLSFSLRFDQPFKDNKVFRKYLFMSFLHRLIVVLKRLYSWAWEKGLPRARRSWLTSHGRIDGFKESEEYRQGMGPAVEMGLYIVIIGDIYRSKWYEQRYKNRLSQDDDKTEEGDIVERVVENLVSNNSFVEAYRKMYESLLP